MALEDRCSPQSAPSPPHHHHSSQAPSQASTPSTTTTTTMMVTMGERELAAASAGSSPSRDEMSLVVIKQEPELHDHQQPQHQQAMVGGHGQQQPTPPATPSISFSITNILSDRFGLKAPPPPSLLPPSTHTPSPSPPISPGGPHLHPYAVLQSAAHLHPSHPAYTTTTTLTVGPHYAPHLLHHPHHPHHYQPYPHHAAPIVPQAQRPRESLFRPYDIAAKSPARLCTSNGSSAATPHPYHTDSESQDSHSAATSPAGTPYPGADGRLAALPDVYDFSRKSVAALDHRAALLSGFSAAASYPKLHEEIINSHRKFQAKLIESQSKVAAAAAVAAAVAASSIATPASSASSSLPSSLGSLCKTVSQIGQHVAGTGTLGCATTTATTTTAVAKGSPKPIPKPGTAAAPSEHGGSSSHDGGMESSDDAKSETSSSKDGEGGGNLWPAWVYCTRYSDRPSSGKSRTATDAFCQNI
ncbi:segmentation polarity homeobox protein engrailed-like [Anopheles cruzii]|uniref:segmentation polarity homeobox protein engrailed-like n=1 Tax=Anopheles cruzii TaxID=68878 RepID=UPI0022EC3C75|nr:segmentation polarity homeobox protein engrailed-like [Anopheles cruzii]